MKRVCIFAHWDKDSIIDDYVIYYLKALKKVADIIIFVSDCNLESCEISKLDNIADYVIAEKHGEYDFGSYKRGFLLAAENELEYDELIFANDSVYGPFYPLKPIFDKMEKKKCDWWGMTQNSYGIKKENNINVAKWKPHVQSYFIVIKNSVSQNKIFQNFISNIKKESSKEDVIINYELGLTELLKNNFKYSIYIDRYRHTENCLCSKWKKLIKWYRFPFVKTNVIKNGIFVLGEVKDWEKEIQCISDYPVELIKKHSKRYKNPEPNLYSNFNLYRKIRFKILENSPMELRKIVIFLEKNCFKILNALFFNKLKKF